MSTMLKQSIIIENQGGAGGSIATKQVAAAAPDGYTLLAGGASGTFATMPLLYKLDFDPVKALTPVGLTTVDPGALVVNADVPVNSVQELIALAKASPGKLNYGSSIGIGPHFVAELFKINAGVDIVHVPYRGGGPMITDLIAGQVQMTVNGKSVLLPHIQSGKLKALAVTGEKRWKELPDVPTLMELKLLDGSYDSYFGIIAPAAAPPDAIEILNRAINEGMKLPDVAEGLGKLGIEPNPGSVKDFVAFIAAEIPRWREVVRVTNIKIGQ
jgi:tripartite-type tricarboxylate transporter receptor subunit TctC